MDTIEKLHAYHTRQEFTPRHDAGSMSPDMAIQTLKNIPGVVDAIELSHDAISFIRSHEETRNHGV
jgi:exopolysaccharide biosynthesis predicted pyruvyltransferase EpsI